MLLKIFYTFAFGIIMLGTTKNVFSSNAQQLHKNLTLVFTNVLFRHGDRTPVHTYPLDPYKNVSYWPVGWGQLTNIGKEQHYELGQWLRDRYKDFLPDEYSRGDIHVQSTDVDRTLMSASCNLAGLYPPKSKQIWNKDISWQPIPIHTVPEKEDEILAMKKYCPRYEEELERVQNSPEIQEYNRKHTELFEYVSSNTGRPIKNFEDLEKIYNTLFIEELYNFTLPEWTKKVYPDAMKPVASFSFTIFCKTPLQKRLKVGPFLGKVLNDMKEKTSCNGASKKMAMYSAHDTTVANVLMTLDIFDPQSPPYRSVILIELFKDEENTFYVTINYRNSTTRDPYTLTLPGCTTLCEFGKFTSIVEKLIPDWNYECFHEVSNRQFELNSLSMITLSISGVLAILLVFSMACGISYWKKQVLSSNHLYHRLQQEIN